MIFFEGLNVPDQLVSNPGLALIVFGGIFTFIMLFAGGIFSIGNYTRIYMAAWLMAKIGILVVIIGFLILIFL